MFIQILYFDVYLNISQNKLAVFASMFSSSTSDIDGNLDVQRISEFRVPSMYLFTFSFFEIIISIENIHSTVLI